MPRFQVVFREDAQTEEFEAQSLYQEHHTGDYQFLENGAAIVGAVPREKVLFIRLVEKKKS